MTGPEHYRKAEKYLKDAKESELGSDTERWQLATAQVHATLALAAATAIRPSDYVTDRAEWSAWAEVASVETAQRRTGQEVTQ